MNPKAILALAACLCIVGVAALGATVVAILSARSLAPAPVPAAPATRSPAPHAPVPEAPAPAVPAPVPPVPVAPTPVAPAPTASPELVVPPLPPPDPRATPAASPSPPPAVGTRPLRPELGLGLSDVTLLGDLVDVGARSVSVAEKAPKISQVSGGTPAASANLVIGDRVFAVDGKPIGSVAEFESALRDKTAPGEVTLRTGKTASETRDVKLVVR